MILLHCSNLAHTSLMRYLKVKNVQWPWKNVLGQRLINSCADHIYHVLLPKSCLVFTYKQLFFWRKVMQWHRTMFFVKCKGEISLTVCFGANFFLFWLIFPKLHQKTCLYVTDLQWAWIKLKLNLLKCQGHKLIADLRKIFAHHNILRVLKCNKAERVYDGFDNYWHFTVLFH